MIRDDRYAATWPWPLFACLVLLAAACLVVPAFVKPAVSLSTPKLSAPNGEYRAEFEAVNNTDQPQTAVVETTFGVRYPGSDAGEAYRELARTRTAVRLAPRGHQPLGGVFPGPVATDEFPAVQAHVASVSMPASSATVGDR